MKYADHMANLSGDCPPRSAYEANATCFRFVWNPIGPESFVPVAFMPSGVGRRPTCKAMALSMFATEMQARARIRELELTNPQVRKRLGDHLAEVRLTPEHGLQTTPDTNGHFSLYEYAGADLPNASQVVGAL